MKALLFLLCFGFATQGSSAWESNGVTYECPGSNAVLPSWLELPSSATLVSLTWTYHGNNATKHMSKLVGDEVVIAPDYINRVVFNKNGYFNMRNVNAQDTGTYVQTADVISNGERQTYKYRYPVVVFEPVIAKQSFKADWNFDSESFSLSLTCGDFTYIFDDVPPIDVEWITPDGSVKSSTKFCDGKFYLELDNPVKGGQYVCRIPKESFSSVCSIHNVAINFNKDKAHNVTVNVDEDKARAMLLENNDSPLREDAKKCISRSSSDCEDRDTLRSGKRTVDLTSSQSVEIYCDQHTDGGRWNVFQRRYDGSVDFNRGWSDYRQGFGDPDGEFWLGLENLHQMTSDGRTYELRFDIESKHGTKYYAVYEGFKIGSESEGYAIRFDRYSGGTVGNNFWYHKNMKFSTEDHDQDLTSRNCAAGVGGWWFKYCAYINLNGNYGSNGRMKGIWWEDITGFYGSLKTTEMKFRVKQ